MSTAQPIKDRAELEQLRNYYLEVRPNLRNHALICTGINTALRISDILSIKWGDVYNFRKKRFQKHIFLVEQKTGKNTCIAINHSLETALQLYMKSLEAVLPGDYIFYGKSPDMPLSRSQAFRIITRAGENLQLSGHISCHSLRKTFGYHAWNSGVNPTVLMVIYNHSSFSITKRYLGIEQEDKDAVFLNLNL